MYEQKQNTPNQTTMTTYPIPHTKEVLTDSCLVKDKDRSFLSSRNINSIAQLAFLGPTTASHSAWGSILPIPENSIYAAAQCVYT